MKKETGCSIGQKSRSEHPKARAVLEIIDPGISARDMPRIWCHDSD